MTAPSAGRRSEAQGPRSRCFTARSDGPPGRGCETRPERSTVPGPPVLLRPARSVLSDRWCSIPRTRSPVIAASSTPASLTAPNERRRHIDVASRVVITGGTIPHQWSMGDILPTVNGGASLSRGFRLATVGFSPNTPKASSVRVSHSSSGGL